MLPIKGFGSESLSFIKIAVILIFLFMTRHEVHSMNTNSPQNASR